MNQISHDLAILYLNHQDISSLTPAQLYDKYKVIYTELQEQQNSQKQNSVSVLK